MAVLGEYTFEELAPCTLSWRGLFTTYHIETIIMKQVVMGASKMPNKKRHVPKPAKLWQAAVIINIPPHPNTHADTILAMRVFCAAHIQGYSATR